MSEKIRVNVYFPINHPVGKIEKGKRAKYINNIIDEWYARDQRLLIMEDNFGQKLTAIENTLNQIKEKLQSGATVTVQDKTFDDGMNELMFDILNLGKKGN